MTDRFGFKYGDLDSIVQIISKFPLIKKVTIFGSRAKGNYQIGSDVDLAVWADNNETARQLAGILNDETLLPFKFDVLNYNLINNEALKDHINRVGIDIYVA